MADKKRKHEDQTLLALVEGKTVEEAATASGVSVRTVHRRLQQAEFRDRLTEARNAYVMQTVGRLSESATKAVDTLEELLDAKMEPVRLGAARAILEIGLRMRREFVLERRIQALEDAQTADGATQGPSVAQAMERHCELSGVP